MTESFDGALTGNLIAHRFGAVAASVRFQTRSNHFALLVRRNTATGIGSPGSTSISTGAAEPVPEGAFLHRSARTVLVIDDKRARNDVSRVELREWAV